MKRILFIFFLLYFCLTNFSFAQQLGSSFITKDEIIYHFENLRTQLDDNTNFGDISSQIRKIATPNQGILVRDTLDKNLFFVGYTIMSREEDIFYNSQFLLYEDRLLTFSSLFLFYENEITLTIDSISRQETILHDSISNTLMYKKIFSQNIADYEKAYPKAILNYDAPKAETKIQKAINTLINQKALDFNYTPKEIFKEDLDTALYYITFLIQQKESKALEKLIYTADIKSKALSAGALLYLQENKGIKLNKIIRYRIEYILKTEKQISIITENCNFLANETYFFAKDFEKLFKKYATNVPIKK